MMGVRTLKLGGKSSILSIEHVTHGHAGTYTCMVSNFAGKVRYSANLTVHGSNLKDIFCAFVYCVYMSTYFKMHHFAVLF